MAATAGRGAGLVGEGSLTLQSSCAGVQHVDHAGREEYEAGRIAPVERKLANGVLAHGVGDLSVGGVDERGTGFDVDRLGLAAYLQGYIDRGLLADRDGDAGLLELLEA